MSKNDPIVIFIIVVAVFVLPIIAMSYMENHPIPGGPEPNEIGYCIQIADVKYQPNGPSERKLRIPAKYWTKDNTGRGCCIFAIANYDQVQVTAPNEGFSKTFTLGEGKIIAGAIHKGPIVIRAYTKIGRHVLERVWKFRILSPSHATREQRVAFDFHKCYNP